MKIGLNDIDPYIARQVKERICAPECDFLRDNIYWGGALPFTFKWAFPWTRIQVRRKRDPTETERAALAAHRARDEHYAMRAGVTVTVPLLAAAVAAVPLFWLAGPVSGAAGGLIVWLLGMGAGVRWSMRARPHILLGEQISLEEMNAVFRLLTLSRSERIYADTLLLLARSEVGSAEEPVRATLRQINALVEHSRMLEHRRTALLPVMGSNALADLEEQYAELGRKIDQTTDDLVRQSLQQSLQMIWNRLENARAFEQGLERLRAQEQAIRHTLASAQAALARMQLAPEVQTALAAQEIADTVTRMNLHTRAVEQAVQEVMMLGNVETGL